MLGEVFQRGREQTGGRFLSGSERERGDPHQGGHFGRRPVGVRGQGQVGEHVLARLTATVLDVLREPVVQPRERVQAGLAFRTHTDLSRRSGEPEPFSEALVVGLGDAQDIGDDEHGEGLRVCADELAAAVGEELAELLVGETPHERFVVLQPLRRDQPHQQRALPGVRGWIHRDEVFVHRELVAVAIDDGADVVTFEGDRKGRERTDH